MEPMISHDKIRALMHDAGLSHVFDDLMKATKPAIHITRRRVADESALELGASKLGGSPDLPNGFIWPQWRNKPLTFIAQIRLSEVAPYDVEQILPPTGYLYFFYEANAQPWGGDPDHLSSFQVLFVEDERAPLERVQHPIAQGWSFASGTKYTQIEALHPCPIEFSTEVTVAPDFIYKLSQEDGERLFEVNTIIKKALWPMHQILGYSEPQQDEMELDCQLITNGGMEVYYQLITSGVKDNDPRRVELEAGAPDWILLLQIDTDDDDDSMGTMWGDVGMIYYWIQKQALAARNFDNCCLILQCG